MSLYGAQAEACHLTIAAPSAGGLGSSAYTTAALYMPNLFGGSSMMWRAYNPSNFSQRGLFCDGDMWMPTEQADTNIPSFGNPANWYWFVTSKDSVTEAPRAHWAVYNSSGVLNWTHLDALSTQAAAAAIDRISIGDEFGTQFRGNIACLAIFLTEMTDAAIESLFLRSSADIMAASPEFFVHWPQADGIGSPFHDIAGGGVETIRSGNWDVSADPPGFSFALGRSGKPKTWDGTSWVQHVPKVWNGTGWSTAKLNGATVGGWITSK